MDNSKPFMKKISQASITCCKIAAIYNGPICFSDCDTSFFFEKEYYEAQRLCLLSNISKSRDLEHDNFEMRLLMHDKSEAEMEVFLSLIEGAAVEVFTLDTTMTEKQNIQSGIISKLKILDQMLYITVFGIGCLLQKPLTEVYSVSCRALFGDDRCKFDRSKISLKTQIKEVVSKNKFHVQENITKQYNTIKFLSGNNAGRETEIASTNGHEIIMVLDNLLFDAGDVIELIPGCDKSIKTCSSVYKNALNLF